jgi:hypothetical protein
MATGGAQPGVGRGRIEEAGYIGHCVEYIRQWPRNHRKTKVIGDSRGGWLIARHY